MLRGRRTIGVVVAALLLVGAVAILVMRRGAAGPFPSDRAIAERGFAAWPVDTPREARKECSDAPDWRESARETALRFAAEVLGYPDPTVDSDFASEDEHSYRTLINSRDVKGVFLGSVLTIRRFGECWYITDGEPREGGAGIDVVTVDGGTRLVVPVGCCGSALQVGWGGWTKRFAPRPESGEVIVEIPDEARGEPGHAIVMDFDKQGVSETVGIDSLPPLPTAVGAKPLAKVDIGRRPKEKGLCQTSWARREHPERILGELRQWVFSSGLELTPGGYLRFDSRSVRRLGSDFEWRLRLDEADMTVHLSRAADRCWLIRSIRPLRARIIESVSFAGQSLTFDVDPGAADTVFVYSGGEVTSLGTKDLLDRPFSVSLADVSGPDRELPLFVLAVTYREGNLHSAEYKLFEPPGQR